MPLLAGHIQYQPSPELNVGPNWWDGVCSEACMVEMFRQCHAGLARTVYDPAEGLEAMTSRRYRIMGAIPLTDSIGYLPSGAVRRFILTGEGEPARVLAVLPTMDFYLASAIRITIQGLLPGFDEGFDAALTRFQFEHPYYEPNDNDDDEQTDDQLEEDQDMPAPVRDPMQQFMYNEDPFAHFRWDLRNKPNALVFGVELEMEHVAPSEPNQRALVLALGGPIGKNFLLKGDGSLNYGVELVTMPFTLAQHLDGTGIAWAKILSSVQGIARSGARTTACGIHIHINKKALSALTIGKMLVFLNDPGLASLITTIAQRSSSGYCHRGVKKLVDGTRSSESRYDIMNVSVRHPTCEIRMFRGNVTLERVYKNIEFCHALVQYCRQSSMRTLTEWGNFSAWLIAHRGQYPNLVRFLTDMQTIGFRHLAKDSRDGSTKIIDR